MKIVQLREENDKRMVAARVHAEEVMSHVHCTARVLQFVHSIVNVLLRSVVCSLLLCVCVCACVCVWMCSWMCSLVSGVFVCSGGNTVQASLTA